MEYIQIAIDGPAGAGKSTVAREVAKIINAVYVDTGAMYRSVALYCIQNNIDYNNESELENIVTLVDIKISYYKNKQHIYLNNEDVTYLIRTEEVSKVSSKVAKNKLIRLKLVELQRKIAQRHNVVMDGRDIGSYVLKDADLKVFLTASVEQRALRRLNQLKRKNIECTIEEIKEKIKERDFQDMNREFSPLTRAEDAIEVDTSNIGVQEAIDLIVDLAKEKKLFIENK